METSYQDMNQNPGTLMGWSSCHRPPRYQAGSLGARLIMAPPVPTSMRSAKTPRGPPTALMISISGRCCSALTKRRGASAEEERKERMRRKERRKQEEE